jgi:hypothetical protein
MRLRSWTARRYARHAKIRVSANSVPLTTIVNTQLSESRPCISGGFIIGRGRIMRQVLITISKGIIDQVVFFDDPKMAVQALSRYVKAMNPEYDDAAVYDPDGLIANAKHFLNDHDEYFENKPLIAEVGEESNKPTYVIANPEHRLGFMVVSPDDPLGFHDPAAALSELGQIRKDSGNHIKLYRVIEVKAPVTERAHLERHNADCDLDDFDYSLVEEYLTKNL